MTIDLHLFQNPAYHHITEIIGTRLLRNFSSLIAIKHTLSGSEKTCEYWTTVIRSYWDILTLCHLLRTPSFHYSGSTGPTIIEPFTLCFHFLKTVHQFTGVPSCPFRSFTKKDSEDPFHPPLTLLHSHKTLAFIALSHFSPKITNTQNPNLFFMPLPTH